MSRPARPAPRWLAAVGWLLAAPLAHAQPGTTEAPSAPDPVPAAAAPAPEAQAPAPPSGRVPRLRVEAPTAVRELLSRYLDLARAIAQPDAAVLSELEWSRLIASTPAQVRSLVQPLGYFAADATARRDPQAPETVQVTVTLGPQATVGRLTFEVQGALAELAAQSPQAATLQRALQQDWPLPSGSAFSNSAWSDAKTQVIARLRAEGYATASWAGTAAQVDPESASVRLFVVVDSGPLYRAGPIEIEGLQHHDADRVLALAPFSTGEALTEARLLDYQERLRKSGLFDQVNVSLDGDPARADAARVLVQLRESPRQAATVALGYSANTGPRVTLEHTQRRLLGWPLTARNKLLWGRDEQSWDGELATHADSQFQRWSLGGTVDRLISDTDLVLSQRLRFGRSQDADGIERFAFVEAERGRECARSNGMNSDCVDVDALSTHLHLTWRQLDNAVLPTRGYTLQWQGGVGLARGSASERGSFGRLYGRATGYWPLGRSWYSQARLELGQVFARDAVQVPDSLRFRAGGDDSVRGYAYRSLAPSTTDDSVTGGRVLWTASAEVARPVSPSLPAVWWAAFIDVGRAADHWSELDPAVGYGAGVRWRSPVGPLRLDLAWGQETRQMRLHLSVGIAF